MYSIKLPWKNYNVSLPVIETWLRANAGVNYAGNQTASDGLELWFTSEPSGSALEAIAEYWDGITIDSPEATSYVSRGEVKTAVQTLRTTMINKSWDELTVAERKVLLGQQPTLEELGLA